MMQYASTAAMTRFPKTRLASEQYVGTQNSTLFIVDYVLRDYGIFEADISRRMQYVTSPIRVARIAFKCRAIAEKAQKRTGYKADEFTFIWEQGIHVSRNFIIYYGRHFTRTERRRPLIPPKVGTSSSARQMIPLLIDVPNRL